MAMPDEGDLRTVEYLGQRIVEALDVLERNDWYAARLILADLWQELEGALTIGNQAPNQSPPLITPIQRKRLRRQVADLAVALKKRPQSESQEMALELERILKR